MSISGPLSSSSPLPPLPSPFSSCISLTHPAILSRLRNVLDRPIFPHGSTLRIGDLLSFYPGVCLEGSIVPYIIGRRGLEQLLQGRREAFEAHRASPLIEQFPKDVDAVFRLTTAEEVDSSIQWVQNYLEVLFPGFQWNNQYNLVGETCIALRTVGILDLSFPWRTPNHFVFLKDAMRLHLTNPPTLEFLDTNITSILLGAYYNRIQTPVNPRFIGQNGLLRALKSMALGGECTQSGLIAQLAMEFQNRSEEIMWREVLRFIPLQVINPYGLRVLHALGPHLPPEVFKEWVSRYPWEYPIEKEVSFLLSQPTFPALQLLNLVRRLKGHATLGEQDPNPMLNADALNDLMEGSPPLHPVAMPPNLPTSLLATWIGLSQKAISPQCVEYLPFFAARYLNLRPYFYRPPPLLRDPHLLQEAWVIWCAQQTSGSFLQTLSSQIRHCRHARQPEIVDTCLKHLLSHAQIRAFRLFQQWQFSLDAERQMHWLFQFARTPWHKTEQDHVWLHHEIEKFWALTPWQIRNQMGSWIAYSECRTSLLSTSTLIDCVHLLTPPPEEIWSILATRSLTEEQKQKVLSRVAELPPAGTAAHLLDCWGHAPLSGTMFQQKLLEWIPHVSNSLDLITWVYEEDPLPSIFYQQALSLVAHFVDKEPFYFYLKRRLNAPPSSFTPAAWAAYCLGQRQVAAAFCIWNALPRSSEKTALALQMALQDRHLTPVSFLKAHAEHLPDIGPEWLALATTQEEFEFLIPLLPQAALADYLHIVKLFPALRLAFNAQFKLSFLTPPLSSSQWLFWCAQQTAEPIFQAVCLPLKHAPSPAIARALLSHHPEKAHSLWAQSSRNEADDSLFIRLWWQLSRASTSEMGQICLKWLQEGKQYALVTQWLIEVPHDDTRQAATPRKLLKALIARTPSSAALRAISDWSHPSYLFQNDFFKTWGNCLPFLRPLEQIRILQYAAEPHVCSSFLSSEARRMLLKITLELVQKEDPSVEQWKSLCLSLAPFPEGAQRILQLPPAEINAFHFILAERLDGRSLSVLTERLLDAQCPFPTGVMTILSQIPLLEMLESRNAIPLSWKPLVMAQKNHHWKQLIGKLPQTLPQICSLIEMAVDGPFHLAPLAPHFHQLTLSPALRMRLAQALAGTLADIKLKDWLEVRKQVPFTESALEAVQHAELVRFGSSATPVERMYAAEQLLVQIHTLPRDKWLPHLRLIGASFSPYIDTRDVEIYVGKIGDLLAEKNERDALEEWILIGLSSTHPKTLLFLWKHIKNHFLSHERIVPLLISRLSVAPYFPLLRELVSLDTLFSSTFDLFLSCYKAEDPALHVWTMQKIITQIQINPHWLNQPDTLRHIGEFLIKGLYTFFDLEQFTQSLNSMAASFPFFVKNPFIKASYPVFTDNTVIKIPVIPLEKPADPLLWTLSLEISNAALRFPCSGHFFEAYGLNFVMVALKYLCALIPDTTARQKWLDLLIAYVEVPLFHSNVSINHASVLQTLCEIFKHHIILPSGLKAIIQSMNKETIFLGTLSDDDPHIFRLIQQSHKPAASSTGGLRMLAYLAKSISAHFPHLSKHLLIECLNLLLEKNPSPIVPEVSFISGHISGMMQKHTGMVTDLSNRWVQTILQLTDVSPTQKIGWVIAPTLLFKAHFPEERFWELIKTFYPTFLLLGKKETIEALSLLFNFTTHTKSSSKWRAEAANAWLLHLSQHTTLVKWMQVFGETVTLFQQIKVYEGHRIEMVTPQPPTT